MCQDEFTDDDDAPVCPFCFAELIDEDDDECDECGEQFPRVTFVQRNRLTRMRRK